MDVLFNELSLAGQFSNEENFLRCGLFPIINVLKEMQGFSIQLLKKKDVWNEKVSPTSNLHSVMVSNNFRKSDEIRRFKTAIASLCKDPYWDDDIKQNANSTYFFNGNDIWGSSPAEASERDKVIVSFGSSLASANPVSIIRNGTNLPLVNLTLRGTLTEHLWESGQISFESYLKSRFSGGKLDFSMVCEKMGFQGIQTAEQALFVDTFRKFEELTWNQIYTDIGIDFKEYHGNLDQRYHHRKTHKFRASQKIRCHGYRENDSFIVIGFEIDHQLSDQG